VTGAGAGLPLAAGAVGGAACWASTLVAGVTLEVTSKSGRRKSSAVRDKAFFSRTTNASEGHALHDMTPPTHTRRRAASAWITNPRSALQHTSQ
jgi:hypothetical protein